MASKRTNARRAREFMAMRAITKTGLRSENCHIVEMSKEKRNSDMNATIMNYGLAKSEAVRKPNASSENKLIELEKKALFTGALHGARQDDFSENSLPALLDSIDKVEKSDYTPERKSEIVAHYFDSPAVLAAYEARKAEVAALIEQGNASKAAKAKKHDTAAS